MARLASVIALHLLFACSAPLCLGLRRQSRRESAKTKAKDAWRAPAGPLAYTFGAPAASSPGFQRPRMSSPCFPILRIVTIYERTNGVSTVDHVVALTHAAGSRFAWSDLGLVDNHYGEYNVTECSEEAGEHSRFRSPNLHVPDEYDLVARPYLPTREAMMMRLARTAYKNDLSEIEGMIVDYNFRLVATVFSDPSYTHLFQDPNTLECVIAFRGSESVQAWLSNAEYVPSHFCGFVEEDETCNAMGTCKPRGKGSFVHRGFRNWFRRVVQSEEWQTKMQPALPKCSKVTATGHSLGGAIAELYTVCRYQLLNKGDYGYEEDYKYIRFTPNLFPGRLSYL